MYARSLRLMSLLVMSFVLGSCGLLPKAPGTTVVEFYNHSGRTVLVESNELRSGKSATFSYPTDSEHAVIVFWGGCVHTYIAPSARPGEFRGTDWMLRGKYRVQFDPDSSLYLLPPGVSAPAEVSALTQPEGFPLRPREGSSCLH